MSKSYQRLSLLLLLLLSLLFAGQSFARTMSEAEVPEPLKPWIDWVLWEHQEQDCPMLYNGTERRCIWPSELALDLMEKGGGFQQTLQVYRESQIPLPGDVKRWPMEVAVNGIAVAVTARDGSRPHIQLPPGSYRVAGRFQWQRLPESLPLPAASGLISLHINGQPEPHPELRNGQLWLRGKTSASPRTPEESLNLELYRKINDDHPLQITTHLRLQVSGKQRELTLGKPLLEGFIPLAIRSPLPARLEPDGNLRLQVRPGEWALEIQARHPDYLTRLPLKGQPEPWPTEEIWSFESNPSLRLVEVEGAPLIDPRQTRMPPAWHALPAYHMQPEQALAFKVIRRGDPQPEPDRLSLQRDLWLDFDGGGYTLRDRINGTMTSGWRLSVDPEIDLGKATLNGEPQFITRLPDSERRGVEVRLGNVALEAESRFAGSGHDLPASGWAETFQQVGATLHLPPGWRLLAITGVDAEHHSWLRQWTLYDLFLLFVIAAAVGRLWGWRWSLPTLLALALIWHEPGAPRHIWLVLLALSALLRVLPEGRYRRAAELSRGVALTVLAVIALPFMVDQARYGLYPQLEYPGWVSPPLPKVMPQMAPSSSMPPQVMERGGRALEKGLSSFSDAVGLAVKPQAIRRWQPDPNARVQTGPGLPDWQWRQIPLTWNGPVAENERLNLTLLSPAAGLLLNLLRILLVLLLVWIFLDRRTIKLPKTNAAATSALLLLALPLSGIPQKAVADYPPAELLDSLEQRLIQPPDCLPQCADIQRLRLDLDETRLQARIRVHASERTAIPLPLDPRQQTPYQVLIEGEPAAALARDDKGQLWLEIAAGTHEVLLGAALRPRDQMQLPLPLQPHRVEVVSEVWAVEGLDENLVPDRQLHLTRKQQQQESGGKQDGFTPQTLPPFVQVERTLHLGLEWSVETLVRRLSPGGAPIALHLPLLAEEAVITEGLRVKEGEVLVNMGPNAAEVRWESRLPLGTAITLTAPETQTWVERWQLDLGPTWHARIEGIAPVHHQGGARWLPSWQPWPGEQVALHLSRPEGVGGATRTIDRSRLLLKPGKRASDAELEFRLRSSQGGSHSIRLPAGVELLSVRIDGKPQPIRLEGDQVSLPVHPGEQTYQLTWREERGISRGWTTPAVDLGLPSVNSELQVQLGHDRWVLFAQGPRLGPAVLFWGELLVILLVAVILGRMRDYSPLRTLPWLLLGIGLSQVSIWSGLLVVGTFFAFGYRRRIDPEEHSHSFNLLQVGLVLLSLLTLSTLFWAVQQGLLGLPQMQVGGNGSSAYQLNWYQDRSGEQLPLARVFSVPLLVYRLLMLAWALWLAFSLLSWVKWAWESFSHRGRWSEVKFELPKKRLGKKAAPEKPED
jgi:hypothetical protein